MHLGFERDLLDLELPQLWLSEIRSQVQQGNPIVLLGPECRSVVIEV